VDVVLGAGTEMGRAIARRLAGAGRQLLIADRDLAPMEMLASELGPNVRATALDVVDPLAGDALAELVPHVDVLVTAGRSVAPMSGRQIIEAELVGTVRVLEAAHALVGAGSAVIALPPLAESGTSLGEAVDRILDRPLEPSILDDLRTAGIDCDDAGAAGVCSRRAVTRFVRRTSRRFEDVGARLLAISRDPVDDPFSRPGLEYVTPLTLDGDASEVGVVRPEVVALVVEMLAIRPAGGVAGVEVMVDEKLLADLLV